jgi:integrase
MEGVRLRVKDVDFARNEIIVRDGKGQKDRVTVMPSSLVVPLKQHIARVQFIHRQELAENRGDVYLPDALARKYPKAPFEWRLAVRVPRGGSLCRSAQRSCATTSFDESAYNALSSSSGFHADADAQSLQHTVIEAS